MTDTNDFKKDKGPGFWDSTWGTVTKITGMLTAVTAFIVAVKSLFPPKELLKEFVTNPLYTDAEVDVLQKANQVIFTTLATPSSDPQFLSQMLSMQNDMLSKLAVHKSKEIAFKANHLAGSLPVYIYLTNMLNRVERWDKKFLANYPIWRSNLYWDSDVKITIHPINLQGFNFQEMLDSILSIKRLLSVSKESLNSLPDVYFSTCSQDFSKINIVNNITYMNEFEHHKEETLIYLRNWVEGSSESVVYLQSPSRNANIKLYLFNMLAFDPHEEYDTLLKNIIEAKKEYANCIQSSLSDLQIGISNIIGK